MADYSIWIVEYARVVEYPTGAVLYGRWNAGHVVLPYCYAVLKGEGHLAVVDTGFNYAEFGKVLADKYGVSDWRSPEGCWAGSASTPPRSTRWSSRTTTSTTPAASRRSRTPTSTSRSARSRTTCGRTGCRIASSG